MSDTEKPLSYLEWIRSVDTTTIPNSKLFDEYNQYLISWYKEKKKETEYFSNFKSNLFRDLLAEIAINYSSEEERQFLSQIDLTNKSELDLIVPFFVKRLKEISKYLITKRHQVQLIKHKKNIKGSELGVFTDIKGKIVDPLNDPNFVDKYPTANIPSISAVADYIYVEIEPLIDEYDAYFDSTETISISSYVSSDTEYINKFKSNTEAIDKNVWLDVTTAIEDLIDTKVPLTMEVNESTSTESLSSIGFVVNPGDTFDTLQLNYKRSNLQSLPGSEFTNQVKEQSNLNILAQKRLIEKYSGTKMLYLSTGTTTSNFVSGVLFDPPNKSANYLNRYNAAHPSVPTTKFLKTEKDVGKFFTPDKQGLLNFERLDSYIELDNTKLLPNSCYVYPDIEQFEPGRGSSLTDAPIIFRYVDDNTAVKGSKSNPYIEGKIRNDSQVQKHYPYQSVEETQQLQGLGISRWTDDVDFWEGTEKDVWSKDDIYTKLPLQNFPIGEKQDDLLVSDRDLYKWTTDIYGNEYALFKTSKPTRKTTAQVNEQFTKHPVQSALDTSIPSTTGTFDVPTTKYFEYQLSGSTTEYLSSFNALTADKTISEESVLSSPHLYFRNSRSTIISPTSAALSGVFVKYSQDADIKSEIDGKVVDFDVIRDVIILRTENYIILEKYEYNVDTDVFVSVLPFKVLVSKADATSSYEKLGNYWYDEINNNFYICKLTLHSYLSGSNYRAIYPEIFVYNDDDITFSRAFGLETLKPAVSSAANMGVLSASYGLLLSAGFVVGDPYTNVGIMSGTDINIVEVESPTINVNSKEYTVAVNFMGVDAGDVQYLFNYYFDSRDHKRLKPHHLDMFSPNANVFNHNLEQYETQVTESRVLSSYIESDTLARGVPNHKILTIEGFQSSMALTVQDEPDARYPLVYGSFASSVSGRRNNPGGYKDLTTNTIRMGAGLSASDGGGKGGISEEVADTSIQPYTHNVSTLLHNAALSGLDKDIVITWDMALYTNTAENSAYAQVQY